MKQGSLGRAAAVVITLGLGGCSGINANDGAQIPPDPTTPVQVADEASTFAKCAAAEPLADESRLDVEAARQKAELLASEISDIQALKNKLQDAPVKRSSDLDERLKHAFFRTGYIGYGAAYKPAADMLDTGRFEAAGRYFGHAAAPALNKNGSSPAQAFDSLSLVQRATVHMAATELTCARALFDEAVETERARRQEQDALDQIEDAVTDSYEPRGYEAVMAADYQAIAEILRGRDTAKNNIKLARDWQARERKKYRQNLDELRREADSASEGESGSVSRNAEKVESTFKQRFMDEACPECADIGESVESPYVNPLADFLSGAWAERRAAAARRAGDQAALTSRMSTAQTAYETAQDLNDGNKHVNAAVEELTAYQDAIGEGAESQLPDGRLVHASIGLGRAPERKLAVLHIPLGLDTLVPFQLAYTHPVERSIERVRVETPAGETIGDLDVLTDVEALAVRHFQDRLPIRITKAALATAANFGAQKGIESEVCGGEEGVFCTLVKKAASEALESVTRPGMEAWTTLPQVVAVGRFRVPEGMRELRFVAVDDGSEVTSTTVGLEPRGPTFVYGRGIGNRLEALSTQDVQGTDGGAQTVRLPKKDPTHG